MSLICCCPIRYLESLEECPWSSGELYISHSFKEGLRVEVLRIDVELDVRLFVELIQIEVFDSDTYIILN